MPNLSNVALLVLTALALLAAPAALAEEPCVTSPTTLCLSEGRFEVAVEWRDFEGNSGLGRVVPFAGADSGLFWFFDEANWELLVKVLDGCPVNDHFWVFSAATTNVEYTLHLRDTVSGASRRYSNPLGTSAPAITDSTAFPTCTPPSAAIGEFLAATPVTPPPPRRILTASSCAAGDGSACLAHERFKVDVRWRDFQGNTGEGRLVPFGSDTSALYWFFGPDNWEMLVKVLDGCTVNDHFWVFSAATTNVEYILELTDTFTGDVRTYENPLGRSAPAITESTAFATCSVTEPPRVELVSDPTVLLRHAGDQVLVEARVVDSNGEELPGARVDWSSADPALAAVVPEGPLSARVTALAEPPSSTTVRATYRGIGIDTSVLLASTHPDTAVISSTVIRSAQPDSLVLEPTPQARSLQPGQLLVSLGEPTVLARIVSVTASPDEVSLQAEPAALTDVFENLILKMSGSPLRAEVTNRGQRASSSERRGTNLNAIQCKRGDGRPVGMTVEFNALDLTLDFDLDPQADLEIRDFEVKEFRMAMTGTLSIVSEGPSILIHHSIPTPLRCFVALPKQESPSARLGLFTLSFTALPTVGVEVEAKLAGAGLSIIGPTGTAQGSIRAGIEYTASNGWRNLSERSWSSRLEPFDIDLEIAELEVETWLFGGLEISLAVHTGLLDLKAVETEIFDVRGGASFDITVGLPLDEKDPAYTGPDWFVGFRADAQLKPELTDGALQRLLDRIGIPSQPRFDLTLFDLKLPHLASPRFTISTDRLEIDPLASDTASLSITGPDVEGTVEFLSRKGSLGNLSKIAEAEIVSGHANATWKPTESDSGNHEIFARIRSDALSRTLPYAAVNTVQIEVAESNPTFPLSVAIHGTVNGRLTTSPPGIDCPPVCSHEFPVHTQVQIIGHSAPEDTVVEWSGDCDGSYTSEIGIVMNGPKSCAARFGCVLPKVQWWLHSVGVGCSSSSFLVLWYVRADACPGARVHASVDIGYEDGSSGVFEFDAGQSIPDGCAGYPNKAWPCIIEMSLNLERYPVSASYRAILSDANGNLAREVTDFWPCAN